MTAARCLPPVVPAEPALLVLGSMPGEASLRAQQYYAHPRNLFWSMAEWHLGIERALPYEARIAGLRHCGVALWDVLASCRRRGSLDTAIERASEEPNAIAELLAAHEGIRAVLLNGRRAEASFRRHVLADCLRRRPGLEVHTLPSTSPANQSIPLERRRAAWSLLARYARADVDGVESAASQPSAMSLEVGTARP